jgi:hypothetical protein
MANGQMSRLEFAQVIKERHPVYADVPDDQLITAVLEKYPVYRKQVSAGTLSEQLQLARSSGRRVATDIVEKAPGFGQGVLSGVMNTAFQGGDVIRRGWNAIAPESMQAERVILRPEVQEGIAVPDTPEGRAGRFVSDIAQLAIPATRVAKATTMAPLIARTAAQATTGAAITGAQTGGDVPSMVTAALLHGVAEPVVAAAGALRNALTVKLPEKLYTQIFNAAKDDIALAFKAEAKGVVDPTLAREVLERGVMGSDQNMAVFMYRKLLDYEKQLQVKASKKVLTLPTDTKDKYLGLLDTIEQRFGAGFFSDRAKDAASLRDALNFSQGNVMKASDMLRLRRFLDDMRSTSSFRLDPSLAPKQEELKIAADLLRARLRTVPEFKTLINEERVMIQGFDAVVADAVRRGNRQLLTLTDAIIGGGGMASGVPGMGIGVMAGVRWGQLPKQLTRIGQGLYRAGQSIPRGTEIATRAATAAAASGLTQEGPGRYR